jgi:hypothetical protein
MNLLSATFLCHAINAYAHGSSSSKQCQLDGSGEYRKVVVLATQMKLDDEIRCLQLPPINYLKCKGHYE